MIKIKYPDVAEAFMNKYFRKPRSGGNRERTPSLVQTPNENPFSEQTPQTPNENLIPEQNANENA